MSNPEDPPKLVSVESPFNATWPHIQLRNIQYAILANTHAASLGEVTWTPHICNTQYVKWGMNGYISDTLGQLFSAKLGAKYFIGRDRTLDLTNRIRQTKVDKVICYTDYGISSGMQSAIDVATKSGTTIEYRTLPDDLKNEIFGESFISTAVPITKWGVLSGVALYGLKMLKCIKK